MRLKTARFPNLKLVALSDETHLRSNARIGLDRLGEGHAPLRVEFQNLARAEQGRREKIALLRIGRMPRQELIDLPQQGMTAAIDRLRIERRMDEEPVEAVARQDRPKAGRDRHPALGVEPIGELRDEPIHNFVPRPRAPQRDALLRHPLAPTAARGQRHANRRPRGKPPKLGTALCQLPGDHGITWDIMGVNLGQLPTSWDDP